MIIEGRKKPSFSCAFKIYCHFSIMARSMKMDKKPLVSSFGIYLKGYIYFLQNLLPCISLKAVFRICFFLKRIRRRLVEKLIRLQEKNTNFFLLIFLLLLTQKIFVILRTYNFIMLSYKYIIFFYS